MALCHCVFHTFGVAKGIVYSKFKLHLATYLDVGVGSRDIF